MNSKNTFIVTLAIGLLVACSNDNSTGQASSANTSIETEPTMNNSSTANPFLRPSPLDFQFPQFNLISPDFLLHCT